MTDDKPTRSWQQIAAEAAVERDPVKLTRLADELVRAMSRCQQPTPPLRSQKNSE